MAYPKTIKQLAICNWQIIPGISLPVVRRSAIREQLPIAYCLLPIDSPSFAWFFAAVEITLIQIHLTLMIKLLTPVKNCFIN
jgi:hypothetical protein